MKSTLRSLFFAALISLFSASAAFAMTLEQARATGAVGERLDGTIAAVKASPDAQALVAEVNAKRTQEYQRISKQNGEPADVVAKLAAQQIIQKLPKGALYQSSGGGWTAK